MFILKYKYILFDADDTLLDYEKSEIVALQNLFCKYGHYCSNDVKKAFGQLSDTLWSDFGLDKTTDYYISSHYHEIYYEYSVKRFDILTEEFHITISSQKLSDQYQKELSQCNFLTEGAYEVCRKLSSECEISIITNGLWSTQKMRVEHSRIGRFISYLIVSENARYLRRCNGCALNIRLEYGTNLFRRVGYEPFIEHVAEDRHISSMHR